MLYFGDPLIQIFGVIEQNDGHLVDFATSFLEGIGFGNDLEVSMITYFFSVVGSELTFWSTTFWPTMFEKVNL